MLAVPLLLVFLCISPPRVQCADNLASFVSAISPTMQTDFSSTGSQKSYQAFGLIVKEEAASPSDPKRRKKRKPVCEGVLLSSLVVLTDFGCVPTDDKDLSWSFLFQGESIYLEKKHFYRFGRYCLIKLPHTPSKKPNYPFLSWLMDTQSSDHHYTIRQESVSGVEVYLSSALAYQSASLPTDQTKVEKAIQTCDLDLKESLIALKCSDLSVCQGETVLDGSAFFTFSQTATRKVVSISGLVSLKSSGTFCEKENAPDGRPSGYRRTPKIPDCSDAYVCGRRFTSGDVHYILLGARKLDSQFQFHDETIPSETIVGSFNMHGLKKFSRAYWNEQAETFRNIIERADILALQEVGTTLTNSESDDYKFFRDHISRNLPGRHLKAIDEFAFVYDITKFKISSCETVITKRSIKCSFENIRSTAAKAFTVYNVHLTYSYASERYAELRKIQSDIAAMTDNDEIVMIAGDFNTGGGHEDNTAVMSSSTNVFTDTRDTMGILSNMQFPDPGPTTFRETNPNTLRPRESHYDRFAVGKNVRLMYEYFPEYAQSAYWSVGTILNGDIGDELDKTVIQSLPIGKRLSKKKSSCPPVFHNYKITNQNDRIKYLEAEMMACYPKTTRQYSPSMLRSRDLSDHLPVGFINGKLKYAIATWNMKKFDPTIDAFDPVDKKIFERRKEIEKADSFLKILEKFDIVAAQELTPGGQTSNVLYDDEAECYTTNKAILKKKWYWSATTPELGFAVKKGIAVSNCEDINMTSVSQSARPSFMCRFGYRKKDKSFFKQLTLVNVHVKNDDSSQTTGAKYHERAKDKVELDQEKFIFIVGDFNTEYTKHHAPCLMADSPSLKYTKFDQFSRLDYVWSLKNPRPGIEGCKVYNPEILRETINDPKSKFVFDDAKDQKNFKSRMKAFGAWASVSDHYPVYMKFFVPK